MHIKRDCPKKKGTKKPTEFGPEEPLKKGRRAGKVNNAEGDQREENQGDAEQDEVEFEAVPVPRNQENQDLNDMIDAEPDFDFENGDEPDF